MSEVAKEIIGYVARYGGMCRDCADENGVCPNSGAPCDTDQRRAVIAHTIAALRYGINHRFIPNIFADCAPSPASEEAHPMTTPEIMPKAEDLAYRLGASASSMPKFTRLIATALQEADTSAYELGKAEANYPAGAIENGRVFMDRLEQWYAFKDDQDHLLANCLEWIDLRRCFEAMAEHAAIRARGGKEGV